MFELLSKVSFESLGNSSRIFLDYVKAISSGAPPFIEGMSAASSFWKARAKAALDDRADAAAWQGVVADVRALSERLGAGEATLQKIDALGRGEACCVVTGQQPGVLGGPLLTLYKIVTAVALAARVESEAGVPCLPLYWCGSDDTDFQEVRAFHMLTRDASPLSAELPQQAHQGGLPVGDIEAKWTTGLWHGVRGFAAELSPARTEAVEKAVAAGGDNGEIACAVLMNLVGGRIAVVDGRSPAVRLCASALFADYIHGEDEAKRLIREAGDALEKHGYHAQLTPGQDSGVFLMEDGRRKSVPPENRGALLAAVEADVSRCAPGVALRNLVQDVTFRPVAAVLGPAEIAYRAQIGALYSHFGVPRPADFPRMAATFVPPALSTLLCGAEDLVRDPAGCARRVYHDCVPAGARKAAAEFKTAVEDAARKLVEEVESNIHDRSRGKIRGRLREVEARAAQTLEAVEDAGRTIALERWPFLGDLPQLIRPDDRFQERYYSSLVPFLFADADAESLIGLAAQHVNELLDGRAGHIVYSIKGDQSA